MSLLKMIIWKCFDKYLRPSTVPILAHRFVEQNSALTVPIGVLVGGVILATYYLLMMLSYFIARPESLKKSPKTP